MKTLRNAHVNAEGLDLRLAHNHDQRVGYPAYTTVIQLLPAAPPKRTAHLS